MLEKRSRWIAFFAVLAVVIVVAPTAIHYFDGKVKIVLQYGNAYSSVGGNLSSNWKCAGIPLVSSTTTIEGLGQKAGITSEITLTMVEAAACCRYNITNIAVLFNISGNFSSLLDPSGMGITVRELTSFNGSSMNMSGMVEGGMPSVGNNLQDNITFGNLEPLSNYSFYVPVELEDQPFWLPFYGYNVSRYYFGYSSWWIIEHYGEPIAGVHAFQYSLSVQGLSSPVFDNITIEIFNGCGGSYE